MMNTEPAPNTWPPPPTVPPPVPVPPKPHLLTGSVKWDGWAGSITIYLLWFALIEAKSLWLHGLLGPGWLFHSVFTLHVLVPFWLLLNAPLIVGTLLLLGISFVLKRMVPVFGKAFGEGLVAVTLIWLAITFFAHFHL